MYSLIRFFDNYNYAEQFQKGHLRLSSLSKFKNIKDTGNTPLDKLTKINSVYDYREGAALVLKNKVFKELLPDSIRDFFTLDPIIDLIEFEFCHLLCFYRVDIKNVGFNQFYMQLPSLDSMKDFGDTVAIITDVEKFINRLTNHLDSLSSSLIFNIGNVRYRSPTIDLEPLKVNDKRLPEKSLVSHIVGYDKVNNINKAIINIKDFIRKANRSDIIYRDCFIKDKLYKSQNEWRICIYDFKSNLHKKEPINIEIGDLSDIVQLCNIQELDSTMMHIVSSNNYFPINAPTELFFGNIKRNNFRSVVIDNNPFGTIYSDFK